MVLGNYTHNGDTFELPKRNTLVIGQKATGKTNALVQLCLEDIYNNESVVFIDPVGTAVDQILERIPYERHEDVILIDPSRTPFAINLFDTQHDPSLFARTMVDVVKGIAKYDSLATPRMDDFIRTGTHTLLEVPDSSLVSLYYFLTNKKFRETCLSGVFDPVLKDIWDYFDGMSDKDKRLYIESTINKLRAFLLDSTVRNCIDQRHNNVIIKDKIVLVATREGSIGSDNATFFGLLVLAQVYMDGVQGVNSTIYIDGCHRLMSSLLSNILAVPDLSVVLSLSFLGLVGKEWHPVLFGGVETVVAFRTSVTDSDLLSPEFELSHNNLERELSQVGTFQAYVRANGHTTLIDSPLVDYPLTKNATRIINRCSRDYSSRQSILDKRIGRFFL